MIRLSTPLLLLPFLFIACDQYEPLATNPHTIRRPAMPAGGVVERFFPAPPSALNLQVISNSFVFASWDASPDTAVTGYVVISSYDRELTGMRIMPKGQHSVFVGEYDPVKVIAVSVAAIRGASMSRVITRRLGPSSGLHPPLNFRASSLNESSVTLAWDAVNSAIGYRVQWRSDGGDNGAVTTADVKSVITGLTKGRLYTFSLVAQTDSASSDPTTLVWATAAHMNADPSGKPLRMHEYSSMYESGLNLDPLLGGPNRISMKMGMPGLAQLAMIVYPIEGGQVDRFVVGPAYAIPDFRVISGPAKFDTSVYISGVTYIVPSLAEWLEARPLNQLIDPTSNVKAYEFTSAFGQANGFVVRTGPPGNHHYARVVIKSANGRILQGTYPNRYVEVEVSYQTAPNVPFAKRSAFRPGVPAVVPAVAGKLVR